MWWIKVQKQVYHKSFTINGRMTITMKQLTVLVKAPSIDTKIGRSRNQGVSTGLELIN